MEGFLKRAKSFAEEAAKPNKIAGTAKKSRELALEASNKADEFKTAVLRQADQIQFQSLSKSISDNIPPHLGSSAIYDSELRNFGLTDDLRGFVRGFTSSTFQNFSSLVRGTEPSDASVAGTNVRKDLSEWQERHATLVLTTVEEIKKLRYELCPRVMKDRKFWRIYFVLVSTYVGL
ncbi:uncharacterized protein LOC120211335 [Hibiscus syriacus]|uniref:uncharacterized protein LOC120211335 n=1 Tax=Hibiscus syriacus TaxID=106335 RepID=UPI00192084D8|nr:uncharacterized protein LOC120211335 [Hibiscus syriacus]